MFKFEVSKNTNFSWEKVINGLIWFLFLSGIFLVPLLISLFGSAYSSFDLIKIVVLRLFGVLILLLTIIREIFFPSLTWKSFVIFCKKYWLVPLSFILILGVLVLFSSQTLLSFYGSYARQNGYLSYLLYFLWFALLSFNFFILKEKGQLKKMINNIVFSMFLSASLVSLYAILQYFGIDFFKWRDPAYLTRRAFATLGQPNFLASFLLLTIPLTFYFFIIWKKIWFKFFALISSVLMIAAVFASASRGGLLALFFGLFLFTAYKLFFGSLNKQKKVIISFSFIVCIILSLFLVEKALPGRISKMFDLSYGSSAARVQIYSSAWSLFLNSPLIGYGQENLQDSFFSHYQADWGVHDNVSQVADRAHNLFLDILLSGGLVSLLAHLSLYIFFFILAWRAFRPKKEMSQLAFAITIGLASYLFSLLFNFAVPTTEFYFFLLLALLLSLTFYQSEQFNSSVSSVLKLRPCKKILFTILILGISSFSIYRTVNYFLADYYFNSAISYFFQYRLPEAVIVLEYSDKAHTNPAHRSYYQYISAYIIAKDYPYYEEKATNQMLKERLELALRFPALTITGFHKRALIEQDLGNYEAAATDIRRIRQLAPKAPDLSLAEASIALSASNYDEALVALDVTWQNLPDINHPAMNEEHRTIVRAYRANVFYYRAKVYRAQEKLDLALENYRQAYQEDPVNYMILKEAADMEFSAGNFDNALAMVLQGHKLSPDDFNWPLMVYYIYERQGNIAEASNWLQKAEALGYVPDDNVFLE